MTCEAPARWVCLNLRLVAGASHGKARVNRPTLGAQVTWQTKSSCAERGTYVTKSIVTYNAHGDQSAVAATRSPSGAKR